MLDILEWAMRERGHAFVRLDGSTNVEERQRICDAFNAEGSDLFAFLLSTRAGGQGLNLVGADAVVIHDCDFNPQIDRQAEDRAHRLGQTRPVTVYRLVTADTVDERIVSIAEKKLDLDAAILSDGKAMAAEKIAPCTPSSKISCVDGRWVTEKLLVGEDARVADVLFYGGRWTRDGGGREGDVGCGTRRI